MLCNEMQFWAMPSTRNRGSKYSTVQVHCSWYPHLLMSQSILPQSSCYRSFAFTKKLLKEDPCICDINKDGSAQKELTGKCSHAIALQGRTNHNPTQVVRHNINDGKKQSVVTIHWLSPYSCRIKNPFLVPRLCQHCILHCFKNNYQCDKYSGLNICRS